jgi:hypothetical protein
VERYLPPFGFTGHRSLPTAHSPLSPSPHPPDLTSHPPSAIRHLSSAIPASPFPIPRFRIPHFPRVGRLDPLGALDLPRQPRCAADQVTPGGVAGIHVANPLLGPVFQLLGVLLGQDGHDGPGGHAVFEGVEPCAGLSRDGPGPGALLRVGARQLLFFSAVTLRILGRRVKGLPGDCVDV